MISAPIPGELYLRLQLCQNVQKPHAPVADNEGICSSGARILPLKSMSARLAPLRVVKGSEIPLAFFFGF
jgi:hypothetical protein